MAEFLTAKELANKSLVQALKAEIEKSVACRCLIDEPLSMHTSWRVGGNAKLYVYPCSAGDVGSLIQLCNAKRLGFFTIGYGTNLLISDDGFAGCVIDLTHNFKTIAIKDEELTAGGGAWLTEVVRVAAENGLGGMEKLAGIPGGVGGGMSMNAGAFGMAISDSLNDLTVVDNAGSITTMGKDAVGFDYRRAAGLQEKTVLSAVFQLRKNRANRIVKIVEETIADRIHRNTMMLPSAGSVFKNPPGGFSAKMIEAVGGKGMREGGVEVSQLHANFIINLGGGTASDIVRLICKVRAKVAERFGVELALEVRTLGFSSDFPEAIC